LKAYEEHTGYIGAAIGRVCSRIANARFQLGDQVYQLAANNGTNCLHGGSKGFDRYTWDVVEEKLTETSILLRHVSPHMDEGFPGEVTVYVEYALLPGENQSTAMSIEFRAFGDRTTVINLTNHLYLNLAGYQGDMTQSMYGHMLTFAADHFVPLNESNIPLGEFRPVEGTPFDFRSPHALGARIDADDEQLKTALGYDHNWILRDTAGPSPVGPGATRNLGFKKQQDGSWTKEREPDATVLEPISGRKLEVFTEEPVLHFYSGNYLGKEPLSKGHQLPRRSGFCFETQHVTNSPNEPKFPSVILEPGHTWKTQTIFWFPSPTK
jgi:aldose 1-epimerase